MGCMGVWDVDADESQKQIIRQTKSKGTKSRLSTDNGLTKKEGVYGFKYNKEQLTRYK